MTVTDAAAAGASGTLSLAQEPAPAGPAPSRHINPHPQRPAGPAPQHAQMEETVNRTTPHHGVGAPTISAPDEVDTTTPAHPGAYARGLRWSIGIAAALLLLYLAAPRLADQGAAGEGLMQYRMAVDDGRIWVQQQVFGPRED